MKTAYWLGCIALSLPLVFAGCKDGTTPSPKASTAKNVDRKGTAEDERAQADAKIKANLARLGKADRALAERQQFCAVESENRLGSMGTPVKVMVKDQPVFLCCKGCQKRALADPGKTLAKVKELQAKDPPPTE